MVTCGWVELEYCFAFCPFHALYSIFVILSLTPTLMRMRTTTSFTWRIPLGKVGRCRSNSISAETTFRFASALNDPTSCVFGLQKVAKRTVKEEEIGEEHIAKIEEALAGPVESAQKKKDAEKQRRAGLCLLC